METVHCDVTELANLPAGNTDDLLDLVGASTKQINWAEVIRSGKLDEWDPDLPKNVLEALCTITDATWWIANKDADASEIKWPKAWAAQKAVGRNGPPPANRPAPPVPPPAPRPAVKQASVDNFDQFARTMCKSPELAYLAMMALAVRQNNDPKVRAKYDEVRATIQGHLNAIDNIANGHQ